MNCTGTYSMNKKPLSKHMPTVAWFKVSTEWWINMQDIFFFRSCRCVHLVAELSKIDFCSKEVTKLLPLLAKASNFKHYTQHLSFLETMCKRVFEAQFYFIVILNVHKSFALSHTWCSISRHPCSLCGFICIAFCSTEKQNW